MPWFSSIQAPADVSKVAPTNGDIFRYNSATLQFELIGQGVLAATEFIYLGDPLTDGTWRIGRSGDNLLFQRRESSNWVEKGGMAP